ncbi:MAG: RelA/SpoT family protein [Bacteroidales bacterium]|nr:RelA/SpoT family protein [Bacteroidales bacterium]
MIDVNQEKKEILKRYQGLLGAFKVPLKDHEEQMLRKALKLAIRAHADVRRKSGEPYIYHPLDVAFIVVNDIGLGPTSAACALIHDVVEDTEFITLSDIEIMFSPAVAKIVDGLTKIEEIFDQGALSIQAENYKKMLLTLSDDVRVILIKLADRLHNMRTLDFMPHDKQLKIASETTYLYAPLAHRLGLYAIKSEFEDLAMKYTEPEMYNEILTKLQRTASERESAVKEFIEPIEKKLSEASLKCHISGRAKSVYSIWHKMKTKRVPFEEIYDLFAIRIIVDSPYNREKGDCWAIYSILTDIYRPNPDRLRDWISTPKNNGYEALHTTLMSNAGQWIEVQIRSTRMEEIAEKGYAAHWKYKQDQAFANQESGLDTWLNKTREILAGDPKDALDFLNEFRQNLLNEEIVVYTRKGDLKTMPAGSTILDFAYNIHSELGETAIGAKVNHKLVPIQEVLTSGNQIEVITSKRQKPTEEWLDFVVTERAKTHIKNYLNEEKGHYKEQGAQILKDYLKEIKRPLGTDEMSLILDKTKSKTKTELYYRIATEQLRKEDIWAVFEKQSKGQNWFSALFGAKENPNPLTIHDAIQQQVKDKPESLMLGKDKQDIAYEISTCCSPISGDNVIGILMPNSVIQVHSISCPNATELMSKYGDRMVKTKWKESEQLTFLVGIRLSGFDRKGIWREMSGVISRKMDLNMKSIDLNAAEGVFEGTVMLYISNVDSLNALIDELRKIEGVDKVSRMN